MNQIDQILYKMYPVRMNELCGFCKESENCEGKYPKECNHFYGKKYRFDLNTEAREKARKCIEELTEKLKGLTKYTVYDTHDAMHAHAISQSNEYILVSDIEKLLNND